MRRLAREGLRRCAEALSGGGVRVVVLDEVSIALDCGLLSVGEVLEALAARAPQTRSGADGALCPAGS